MTRKTRKGKPTSVLAMCATVGFFIGLGLGALMNNLLVVMFVVVALGCLIGYQIDKKNGITYGRRH